MLKSWRYNPWLGTPDAMVTLYEIHNPIGHNHYEPRCWCAPLAHLMTHIPGVVCMYHIPGEELHSVQFVHAGRGATNMPLPPVLRHPSKDGI